VQIFIRKIYIFYQKRIKKRVILYSKIYNKTQTEVSVIYFLYHMLNNIKIRRLMIIFIEYFKRNNDFFSVKNKKIKELYTYQGSKIE